MCRSAPDGEATPGLEWRWAIRVRDADAFGSADPTATAATTGVAYDNLNLVYEQYHAEEQIGTGGMGEVHRARHALLRRPVAVKLLPPEHSSGTSATFIETSRFGSSSLISSRPAIANRNIAGPTLVIPVCMLLSAARAGTAMSGAPVIILRIGFDIRHRVSLIACAVSVTGHVFTLLPG